MPNKVEETFKQIGMLLLILSTFSLYGQKKTKLILTSRSFHPRSTQDTMNTVEAISHFKPSRIDWIYVNDATVTKLYTKLNLPYSITINPMVPDSAGYTTKKTRIIDLEGKTYTMPWLIDSTRKERYWGCVNNLDFRTVFYNRTRQYIQLHPYAILVDDANFNYQLVLEKKIGCFCDHCISKFCKQHPELQLDKVKIINYFKTKKEIHSLKNDSLTILYTNFQQESVSSFIENWKKEMSVIDPKLLFLTNNFNGVWHEHLLAFDGGIAELNDDMITETKLDQIYKNADELGKTQLLNSNSSEDYYHDFLLNYTLSHNRETLIPWDLHIKNSLKRYYINYKKFDTIYSNY